MRLSGHFFRALSSKKEEGEIELTKQTALIITDDATVCNEVIIQSIQSKKDIYLDNGFLFTLAEPLTSQQEKFFSNKVSSGIAWLENFSLSKVLILSLVLISALVVFRYTLTSITPLAASIFPQDWEEAIGRNTYETLRKTAFSKTELSSVRVERLRAKAKQLASANGFESPEILFHKADLIGANALAFPRGPVVVTDDLVLLLQKDDLILGIIAHEFAHVQQRHSLQQIIEVIGVGTIASVLLGSNETLIEESSFVGINLWGSKKSREFEKEADLMALEYLENAKLNKSSFGLAIEKLTDNLCSATTKNCLESTESGWLSSHPTGAERLEYLSVQQ